MLALSVASAFGGFSLEAALEVPARATGVVVGESGSGKTTLLRLIAGLVDPDRGRIVVGDDVWFDATARTSRPPRDRSVGLVAQDYALFPHLNAADNVAFGLRAQRVPNAELRRRVGRALERLGIGAFASRRPHELSGGQQQRVAIARALVLEPAVLLLDEPLSALDVQTRRAIRGELRRLLADLPCATVVVTHSPAEALALGDAITVLEAGRVTQHGPRDELMRRPRSAYVAEFLGVNLVRGHLAGGGDAGVRIAFAQGELVLAESGDVAVIVHPRDITLSLSPPAGTARNVFAGTITELVPEPPAGDLVRVSLAGTPPLIADVTRQAVESLGLRAGLRVHASFKAAGVTLAG